MLTIAFIMGGTCAGKSTLLEYCKAAGGDAVGLVSVGKAMRAKYPPDHFKGQAAPKHTMDEAWDMMMSGIKYFLGEKYVKLILVDGQPRDVSQALGIIGLEVVSNVQAVQKRFIYLHCPADVQDRRAHRRDGATGAYLLACDRIKNDRTAYCDVLVTLAANCIVPEVWETDKAFNDYGPALYQSLMATEG